MSFIPSGKKSETQLFYEEEADQGETRHITRHMVKNSLDIKTLDVKIYELRE